MPYAESAGGRSGVVFYKKKKLTQCLTQRAREAVAEAGVQKKNARRANSREFADNQGKGVETFYFFFFLRVF
jgi:hypothetical protein